MPYFLKHLCQSHEAILRITHKPRPKEPIIASHESLPTKTPKELWNYPWTNHANSLAPLWAQILFRRKWSNVYGRASEGLVSDWCGWGWSNKFQQPQNKKVLLSQRSSDSMWLSEPQCCSMMLELGQGMFRQESYGQNTAPWAWTYIQAYPRKYSIKHFFALKGYLSRYLGASLRTLSRSRISMYRKNCTGQRTLCSLVHGDHAFRLHILRSHRP